MTTAIENTIRYIIMHLLGAEGTDSKSDKSLEKSASKVGYTREEGEWEKYKVVIYPCGLFDEGEYGTKESLPQLPLDETDETPIIYGEDETELRGETLIVKADIVASAYFMMARYEEYADKAAEKRDEHGRYKGKESTAFKAGLIDRPIVEEYGKLLRGWLRARGEKIDEPKEEISRHYITHDMDMPLYSKTLRGVIGAIRRGEAEEGIKSYLGKTEENKYFTFPMLKAECDKLRSAHKDKVSEIVFVKSTIDGKTEKEDSPMYDLDDKSIREVTEYLKKNGFELGLHTSYYSGKHLENAKEEAAQLRQKTGVDITKNRYHYLRTLMPQDYAILEAAGITDDYTMGYADVAGFRTGTCRKYRWINPENGEVSKNLWIHPMIVMDCTLGEEKYMGMDEYQSIEKAKELIAQSRRHNGEVTILFHNHIFAEKKYNYERLYKEIIAELCKQN